MIKAKFPGQRMSPFERNGEIINDYGYYVIPYCKNGSLLDFVNKVIASRRVLSLKTKMYICSEVVKAVHELHSQGIAHGDLKLENMVLSKSLTVALIDHAHNQIAMVKSS